MLPIINKLLGRSSDPVLAKTLKKQKLSAQRLKRYEWINRLIVLVASVALIVYFLPNPGKIKFEDIEIGDVWNHPPLISACKFNINMDEDELQVKKDSVDRTFEPYFNHKEAVRDTVKIRIQNATQKLIDNNDRYSEAPISHYVSDLFRTLDSVYNEGVISQESYDSLKHVTTQYIRILDNNIQRPPVSIEKIHSIQGAYQKIMNPVWDEVTIADTLHKQFLSALNLNTLLEGNLVYDHRKSEQELIAKKDSLSPTIGNVLENERIIDRGEIVTAEKQAKLLAYEKEMSKRTSDERPLKTILGQILLVLIIMLVLNSFLYIFRKDYFYNVRAYLMLFILPVVFCALSSTMIEHRLLHIFIVPFCMIPVIIRVFLDSRVAFVFHLGTVLIASICMRIPYEFLLIQIIAGMVAVQTLRQMTQRSQIVSTVFIVTLTMLATHFTFEMISNADFTHDHFERDPYYWLIVSGLLLLFTYPLFWLMEKFFGFTSEVTLVELSNTNNTLLQKLMEEAPGTFQHSTQVAILASEVATKVGANVQLVRTGAMYHDIGKLSRPVFFTENQSGINPHERISPTKSSEVIIGHVTEGVKLAEHYDIPEVIKRFILTHHGKGKVKYFYITYKNQHPDEEIDESLFTYPGPNPESKEEAILMMADAVEAASRSLSEYTEEGISSLVDKIVQSQVDDGFFDDSNITFKDLQIARKALKDRLKTIYHTRITYPELTKSEE